MKKNTKYVALFLMVVTFFAYLEKTPITAALAEVSNGSAPENMTDNSLEYPTGQKSSESSDTHKSVLEILSNPAITNWAMLIVTFLYLIATVVISRVNCKQLKETRLQQRQNVGIQLYDNRKKLLIKLTNCKWVADSDITYADIFFMFDSKCTTIYLSCCDMKHQYIAYAAIIQGYLTSFRLKLPTDKLYYHDTIKQYEDSLSDDPLKLESIDFSELYELTDEYFLNVCLPKLNDNYDTKSTSDKRNLRQLFDDAMLVLTKQDEQRISLIEEMQAIISNSITMDPKGKKVWVNPKSCVNE